MHDEPSEDSSIYLSSDLVISLLVVALTTFFFNCMEDGQYKRFVACVIAEWHRTGLTVKVSVVYQLMHLYSTNHCGDCKSAHAVTVI